MMCFTPFTLHFLKKRRIPISKFLAVFVTFFFIAVVLPNMFQVWMRTSLPLRNDEEYGLLGLASETYVISLPHRDDRRRDMEKLRMVLGLRWVYTNGVYPNSSSVATTLDWVHTIRTGVPHIVDKGSSASAEGIAFSWPENIDDLARSTGTLELWSNDRGIWPLPSAIPKGLPSARPMTSATGNYNISKNVSALPEYLHLTESRVACWLGHLEVIHRIANALMPGDSGFSIILEDDVDAEKDLDQQMTHLWPFLPADWDIVFLGHCWSDEGRGARLSHDLLNVTSSHRSSNSQLHVSQKPKCTHAYALSRIGARRLLLHLRYPPFAFSRAIDQAFAWLVESNRLKSYSVVPSLIVQRKVTESDVTDSSGFGKWKDRLVMGIFEDEGAEGKVVTR